MSELIDMHEPGDRVYTISSDGVPHVYIVRTDGSLKEANR